MKLEGIHHITAITADAQENVDFYAGVLGLRLVKKTVNQDQPTVYHLFFADEKGSAGSDLTFFEFPGVPEGRAGAGDVHRIVWRVGSGGARLLGGAARGQRDRAAARGREPASSPTPRASSTSCRGRGRRRAADRRPPRGPGRAGAAGLPRGARLRAAPDASRGLLEALEFEPRRRRLGGARRDAAAASTSTTSRRPSAPLQGAGSVHHIAWASTIDEHEEWRERAISAGAQPTPVIDRFYFRSIYFREPSGVLFEIATLGPGFTVDEPLEHLGEKLSLPPDFEHLRDRGRTEPAARRQPARPA